MMPLVSIAGNSLFPDKYEIPPKFKLFWHQFCLAARGFRKVKAFVNISEPNTTVERRIDFIQFFQCADTAEYSVVQQDAFCAHRNAQAVPCSALAFLQSWSIKHVLLIEEVLK